MGSGFTKELKMKEAGRKHRFANESVDELILTNLNPIDGYQRSPILPLEKAVASLLPHIDDLMKYVIDAKANCNSNSNFLTVDESAAIYLYTMPKPFFSRLNDALRNRKRHAMTPWLAYLKLFMTALDKLPSITGTIWRGVCGDVGSDYNDDNDVTWYSINSCSKSLKVIEWYIGETGTVFAINALHGKDISDYSVFKEEQEIILMPGCHLRVKSKTLNFDNRLFLVHMEEENSEASSHTSAPNNAGAIGYIPSSLDLSFIKQRPRKTKSLSDLTSYFGPKILTSNNEYLLVYGDEYLCRFDNDLKYIKTKIDGLGYSKELLDIVWCPFISRFIILTDEKFYLLEPITMRSQSIENIQFQQDEKKFVSCACLNDKLYIVTEDSEYTSYLDCYSLPDFNFIYKWTVMELIGAGPAKTKLNKYSTSEDSPEITFVRSNKNKLGLIMRIEGDNYLYVLDPTHQPFQFARIKVSFSTKQLTTLTQSNEWLIICDDYNNTLIQISLNCEFKTEFDGKNGIYSDNVTHIAVFKASCLAVIRSKQLELYTV